MDDDGGLPTESTLLPAPLGDRALLSRPKLPPHHVHPESAQRPSGFANSVNARGHPPPEAVRTLHERLSVLTEDISHKQTLIDRLLKEVDKRSEAIRNCGVEIVELRRANKRLQVSLEMRMNKTWAGWVDLFFNFVE